MDHYLYRQSIALDLLGSMANGLVSHIPAGVSNELFVQRLHHKEQVPLPKRSCRWKKCRNSTRNQCSGCQMGLFLCGTHFKEHWQAEVVKLSIN